VNQVEKGTLHIGQGGDGRYEMLLTRPRAVVAVLSGSTSRTKQAG